MPQVVQCRQCKQRFSAADHLAGRKIACGSCGSALQVPEILDSPLDDLLDDEIQLQSNDDVVMAKVARHEGPTCVRCQDELIPGERYCVSCGHHNFNATETVAASQTQHIADKEREEENARRMALLARPNLFGLLNYWASK